ncbi:dipeptidase [Paenibacillus tarimensis]
MKVVDFHCDVLSKLLTDETLDFAKGGNGRLDVTYERLSRAGSLLQTFAIYIPERMENNMRSLLRSVDLMVTKVLSIQGMTLIRSASDLKESLKKGNIGALLSLEGADGLGGDMTNLRILYYLGVRALGITWNHSNWAADGVLEPRQGGLTKKGRLLVKACNDLGILLDVSHLTDRGFWEVADLSAKPFLASHSNARTVCEHPRNLTDDQIRAMIAMDGRIGVTFVPWFLTRRESATIDDVLRHIEHICAMGGERQLMLGSDFDGIDRHVQQLTHPGEITNLTESLLKRYPEELVRAIMADNALTFLKNHLPE